MLSNFETAACMAAARDLVPGAMDVEILEATLNAVLDKPAPTIPKRKKMRVLALHGFGQSAEFFQMKAKRLTTYLETSLSSDLLEQYPEGVEWSFANGPVRLATETQYDMAQDIDMRAWWTRLDFNVQLEQLYHSLEYLAEYVREHGPFDGILGFSQGASIAMMLTALCEGATRPERVAALANQGMPLLIAPPQAPFKFAVACSGFKNAPQYYGGFFTPKINTPSMHVVAEWDHMVSAQMSADIIDSCEDAVVVRHFGTHALPADKNSMYEISRFITNAVIKATPPVEKDLPRRMSLAAPVYQLPTSRHFSISTDEMTITTVTDILVSGSTTPELCPTPELTDSAMGSPLSSTFELSPGSSVSNYSGTGNKKRRHMRFKRSVTVRRL